MELLRYVVPQNKVGEKMFLENYFIFDGKSSMDYNMKIYNVDDMPQDEMLVAEREYTKVKAPRGSKYRIIDCQESDVLTFSIKFLKEDFSIIDDFKLPEIVRWLFNQKDYKKLQIVSNDMINLYYNCILTNVQKISVAGQTYGFSCTVECDSSCAWEFPYTKNYNFSSDTGEVFQVHYGTFICTCDNLDNKLLPKIKITKVEDGNLQIRINNLTSVTMISNLNDGEIIEIDCENKIISSNLNNNIFEDFMGNFPFFQRGINNIEFWGQGLMEVTYQNQRKVGV